VLVRREFLAQLAAVVSSLGLDPLQGVEVTGDRYDNRRIGLSLRRPADWTFGSVIDFVAARQQQVLRGVALDEAHPLRDPRHLPVVVLMALASAGDGFEPSVSLWDEPLRRPAPSHQRLGHLHVMLRGFAASYADVVVTEPPYDIRLDTLPATRSRWTYRHERSDGTAIALVVSSVVVFRSERVHTFHLVDRLDGPEVADEVWEALVSSIRYRTDEGTEPAERAAVAGLADELWRLYERSHGKDVSTLPFDPLPDDPTDRILSWRETFRQLDFLGEPSCSSRALELAVAWAAGRGSVSDLTAGLYELLGGSEAPPSSLQEYYLGYLRAFIVHGPSPDVALPIATDMTPLQALLALHLVRDPSPYERRQVETLVRALAGQRTRLTPWDRFGGEPQLGFWRLRELDPAAWARVLRSSVAFSKKRKAAPLAEILGIAEHEVPRALQALAELESR